MSYPYYTLTKRCIFTPMAYTSNTKFYPPMDPIYLKNVRKPNYGQILDDSEEDVNAYEQSKLNNYASWCPSCGR